MNKKYLVTLLVLFPLFCNRSLSLARADDSITTSQKWQKLVELSKVQQRPAEDLDRILSMVRRAEKAGFPVNPLLNKALEGTAKGASPTAIQQVLEKRLDYFHTCQKIIQEMPEAGKETGSQRQQALTILAESMVRGVSENELKNLRMEAQKLRSIDLANASEDLATLKSMNISSTEALEILQSGLKEGLYQKGGRKITREIWQARQKGISTQELRNHLLSNMGQLRGRKGMAPMRQDKENITRQQPQGKRNKFKGGGASSHNH